MQRPMLTRATGLGHPEGPCQLDDGRVLYANTYASEIGVWDPATNTQGTYAIVGGGPNACMLGSDGAIYSTQTPMSVLGSPRSTGRPRSKRHSRAARSRFW